LTNQPLLNMAAPSMGLATLAGLLRIHENPRTECRVDLRICLSMSIAAAVALSFVIQQKLHTALGRSQLAHFLAIDHHETPEARRTPNGLGETDSRNMVLLEKHGHSKVSVAGEFMAEWPAPEIDEPIRPTFRLAGEFHSPSRLLIRLALFFRENVDGELVGLLLTDLLGLGNLFPNLLALVVLSLRQCLTPPEALTCTCHCFDI
jgi:hypothetical protein